MFGNVVFALVVGVLFSVLRCNCQIRELRKSEPPVHASAISAIWIPGKKLVARGLVISSLTWSLLFWEGLSLMDFITVWGVFVTLRRGYITANPIFISNKDQWKGRFFLFVDRAQWIKGNATGYMVQVTVKAGFITAYFSGLGMVSCLTHTHWEGHMLLLSLFRVQASWRTLAFNQRSAFSARSMA